MNMLLLCKYCGWRRCLPWLSFMILDHLCSYIMYFGGRHSSKHILSMRRTSFLSLVSPMLATTFLRLPHAYTRRWRRKRVFPSIWRCQLYTCNYSSITSLLITCQPFVPTSWTWTWTCISNTRLSLSRRILLYYVQSFCEPLRRPSAVNLVFRAGLCNWKRPHSTWYSVCSLCWLRPRYESYKCSRSRQIKQAVSSLCGIYQTLW